MSDDIDQFLAQVGEVSHLWKLVGHEPVSVPKLLEWARWVETADRTVAVTYLTTTIRVSTVFLGLDHSFGRPGQGPILFETMVFGGRHDGAQARYATWDEALAGHWRMVARLQARWWSRAWRWLTTWT